MHETGEPVVERRPGGVVAVPVRVHPAAAGGHDDERHVVGPGVVERAG
ncbi:hypothetical protein [Cellulomonas sp. ATA003]|nr:hypothetical protein [Cellulomonas sp. ATA003]WNB86209.1 hypothetical protein REH70_02765 [Cellulomonas sp. ATA003]